MDNDDEMRVLADDVIAAARRGVVEKLPEFKCDREAEFMAP